MTKKEKIEKIIEKYPMFKRIVTKCDCKDFNEHYIKCIKNQKKKGNNYDKTSN